MINFEYINGLYKKWLAIKACKKLVKKYRNSL